MKSAKPTTATAADAMEPAADRIREWLQASPEDQDVKPSRHPDNGSSGDSRNPNQNSLLPPSPPAASAGGDGCDDFSKIASDVSQIYRLVCQNLRDSDQLPEEMWNSIFRSFETLVIWDIEHGVSKGRLDQLVRNNYRVRQRTCYLMFKIARILMDSLYPLLESPPSSLSASIAAFGSSNRSLLQDGQFNSDDSSDDDSGDDSDGGGSQSGHESATELEDIPDYLSTFTQCLVDMGPLYRDPPPSSSRHPTRKFKASDSQKIWGPEQLYSEGLSQRFPGAASGLIAIMGRLCFERYNRCQKLRSQISVQPDTSVLAAPVKMIAQSKGQDSAIGSSMLSVPPGVTLGTIAESRGHDSALGSSLHESAAGHRLEVIAEAAVDDDDAVSRASTAMSFSPMGKDKRSIPRLSVEAKRGEAFKCYICGTQVVFRKNGKWKRHVLEDLQPYVCLDAACHHNSTVFPSQTAWEVHTWANHQDSLCNSTCPLCKDTLGNVPISVLTHLRHHLEDIAIACGPSVFASGSASGSFSSNRSMRSADTGDDEDQDSDRTQDEGPEEDAQTDSSKSALEFFGALARTQELLREAEKRGLSFPEAVMRPIWEITSADDPDSRGALLKGLVDSQAILTGDPILRHSPELENIQYSDLLQATLRVETLLKTRHKLTKAAGFLLSLLEGPNENNERAEGAAQIDTTQHHDATLGGQGRSDDQSAFPPSQPSETTDGADSQIGKKQNATSNSKTDNSSPHDAIDMLLKAGNDAANDMHGGNSNSKADTERVETGRGVVQENMDRGQIGHDGDQTPIHTAQTAQQQHQTSQAHASHSLNATLQSSTGDEVNILAKSIGSSRGKRRSRPDDDDDSLAEGTSTGGGGRRREPPSNYGCPYRKRNPLIFNIRSHVACATQSFADMTRLKRHIRQAHKREDRPRYQCLRCKKLFDQQKALEEHLYAVERCAAVGPKDGDSADNPEDGITQKMEDILVGRRIDTWDAVWRVLFPGDSVVPQSDFEPPVEDHEIQARINEAIFSGGFGGDLDADTQAKLREILKNARLDVSLTERAHEKAQPPGRTDSQLPIPLPRITSGQTQRPSQMAGTVESDAQSNYSLELLLELESGFGDHPQTELFDGVFYAGPPQGSSKDAPVARKPARSKTRIEWLPPGSKLAHPSDGFVFGQDPGRYAP